MTGTDESTSLAFCPLRSHLCYCYCVCFFPASDYPLIGPGDSNFVSQEYRSQSLLGRKMEKFLVPDVVVSVSWGKHSWIQGILNSPVADGMREELLTEQLLSWVRTQKFGIIATEFFERKSPALQRFYPESSGAASQTNLQLEKPFARNRDGLKRRSQHLGGGAIFEIDK